MVDSPNWNRTESKHNEDNWIDVLDLEPGQTYMFRIVAVNSAGETRSDPWTEPIGSKEGKF